MNSKTNNYKKLSGIIPPMITPLLASEKLDTIGVQNLVEHLIKGGVSGIFILGTTGETQHLSIRLREELIRETCKAVAGRLPVLVGITDTSMSESLYLANIAAECKADSLVAAPPYYFALGQPELYEYYQALSEKCPLPLYLYNMPSHTKVMIDPNTVKRLSELPNIVGLKDSSANGVYFHTLLHLFKNDPDFALFVGPEEMMASVVLMGADGGVAGGANLYPELFVALYNAAAAKDLQKVAGLQEKVMLIGESLYGIGRFGSSYIKGIKTALALKGICNDSLAQPFNTFLLPEKQKVQAALMQLETILK
jgi:dihydrodipicolinate synthase/N-acetylneuraminate lyase